MLSELRLHAVEYSLILEWRVDHHTIGYTTLIGALNVSSYWRVFTTNLIRNLTTNTTKDYVF